MSMITLDRQAHALGSAYGYEKHHPAEKGSPRVRPLCVALAREAGTPVAAVAAEVGRQLGWPVHDHDILERIARDLGMNVHALEGLDERRRSWLVECLESFSSRPSVGESVYVRHLLRVFRALATEGHCIIVGRGAAQVLPSDSTLRVLLVGDHRDRCGHLAHHLGLDYTHAARILDEIESERAAFIKAHFNRDARNVDNYDLVVNTSHLSPGDCAAVIAEAVHHREPVAH